jgi:Protein of unknown function (DUF1631)
MPIAPVLQRFVDEELGRAPAQIERTVAGTLQLLRDPKDVASNATERALHFALHEALQTHRAKYQQAFVETLARGVRGALSEQQNGPSAEVLGSAGGLELMDESRVEVDIEISRAMQLIDTTAEWELRELQTFTSTLVGQKHVSSESNPFRPLVYATALWEAACTICSTQVQRATLLRISAGVTAGLLKNAWAAACTRLESQGIEPGIYRTVLLTPGTVAGRGSAAPDSARPDTLANLLANMPVDAEPLDVDMNLATGHFGGAARQGTSAQGERQIIELLTRVFDAILSDPHVPQAFVAVLARLQAPALRVALNDPEMLASTQHPVWRLLDRIGHASSSYPQANDPRAAALLAECHTLAEEIARAARPDAVLYRRAVAQIDTFLGEQLGAQAKAAEPSIQTLRQSERRELLEQNLATRLEEQMASVRASPVMRHFVTSTWASVLAEAMARHGEQSAITRGYIKLVDELLWSLQLPDHPQSRQRLVALLPSMLQRLRDGMQSIGLAAAERENVLNELMAIHTEALRPGRGEPAALTPEQIVQNMRDEVLPPYTGHGGFGDSVIDLASMETVPAELMPSEASADDPAKRVEALVESERLRLFLQGRWARVQLLWRSDQRLFFLFAGETAGRTHSVTRRALERLSAAALMHPLEVKTLVQRSLDRVTRDLARP